MQAIRKKFTVITTIAIIISIAVAAIVSMQYFRKAYNDYLDSLLILKCSNIGKDINAAGGNAANIDKYVENDNFFDEAAVFRVDGNSAVLLYPGDENGSEAGLLTENLPLEAPAERLLTIQKDGRKYRLAWNHLRDGSRLFMSVPYVWPKAYWLSFVMVFSLIAMLMLAVMSLIYEKIASGIVGNLNDMAYKDALTSVRNKGAFDNYIEKLNETITSSEEGRNSEFAMCYFDCNSLKDINDTYGHDKGDLYLKNVCSLICRVFMHSPVFRIGGDEFICILKNDDFNNKEKLLREFDLKCEEINSNAANKWDMVDVARGTAIYDPHIDSSVHDVFRRADALMYEDKQRTKYAQTGDQAVTGQETEQE